MIFEIAQINVKAGSEAAFEQGVAQAAPLFKRAKGYRSMALERCVEQPTRYHLVVGWATVEDHTVHFRQSEDFLAWRRLVGEFFDGAPVVVHTHKVFGADA